MIGYIFSNKGNQPTSQVLQEAEGLVNTDKVGSLARATIRQDQQYLAVKLGDLGITHEATQEERVHLKSLEGSVARRQARLDRSFPDASAEAKQLAVKIRSDEILGRRTSSVNRTELETFSLSSSDGENEYSANNAKETTNRDRILSSTKEIERELAELRIGITA
jgi:hypothetical protein